ncbi:MAG: CBS domain-containing protein [Gemmatimonadota bacterium]
MKDSDLMVDSWVAVPLEADSLRAALAEMIRRVFGEGVVPEEEVEGLLASLEPGRGGEVMRINEQVVGVAGPARALHGVAVAVGVSPRPMEVVTGSEEADGTARAVVLVLAPEENVGVTRQVLAAVARVLRDPARTERLLLGGSISAARSIRELMESELENRHLVAEALVPVQYRVYPDTPLAEVLDLMVRRQVPAIPVVSEGYEVLGVLTSGDALAYLIRRGRPREDRGAETESGEGKEIPLARDAMTRTVLCVSEDQPLLEAANIMVNRDVEQLPVAREGRFVGFVTRESILRALYGSLADENHNENIKEGSPS